MIRGVLCPQNGLFRYAANRSTTKLIFGYDDDDDEEAESDDDNVSERVVLEGALNDLGSLEKRPLAPTLRVDGTHIPPYVYKKVYCDSADLMHLVEVCALPANKDGAKTLHELVIHNIDFTDPVPCPKILFSRFLALSLSSPPPLFLISSFFWSLAFHSASSHCLSPSLSLFHD